jgi:hypothetical protein
MVICREKAIIKGKGRETRIYVRGDQIGYMREKKVYMHAEAQITKQLTAAWIEIKTVQVLHGFS